MTQDNERYLWEEMIEGVFPRDIIGRMLDLDMIQSPKQAWRTLEKWIKRGIYEYGVNLDLGWKVDVNASTSTETAIYNKIGPLNIAFSVPTKKKSVVRGVRYAFFDKERVISQDSTETRVCK